MFWRPAVLLIPACMLMTQIEAYSQDLKTSHLVWNLPTYNVGALTPGNTSRTTFDYRRAGLVEGVSFTSMSAWMDYPLLIQDKNNGAIFFMVQNQQSGGSTNFNTFRLQAALAKKISVTRVSHLTFGLGAGYQQFGMSLNGFTTSSQFVEGIGFDPGLPNGEPSGFYRSSYLTINSGLFYEGTDPRDKQLLRLGISAQNLNKQLKTWENTQSPLPVSWSAQFQYLALTKRNTAVGPDVEVFKDGNTYNAVGGVSVRYYLNNKEAIQLTNDQLEYLNVFARLATQKKGILGVQFTNGKLIAGVSYDFPLGNLSRIYGNAFEVLVALTPAVHHSRQKNEKVKLPEKRSEQKEKPVETKKKVPVEIADSTDTAHIVPDTTQIKGQHDTNGEVSVGGISDIGASSAPVNGLVYFISGSSRLDASSRKYLDALYKNYIKNGAYHITITGYTDDVGSAEDNKSLSLQRAQAAANYLIYLGASTENIEVRGLGEDQPIVPNNSPVNRATNRRVEISLRK